MKRALLALPFLLTFLLALKVMDVSNVIPMMAPMIGNGKVSWDTDFAPLRTSFYNIKKLDDM